MCSTQCHRSETVPVSNIYVLLGHIAVGIEYFASLDKISNLGVAACNKEPTLDSNFVFEIRQVGSQPPSQPTNTVTKEL